MLILADLKATFVLQTAQPRLKLCLKAIMFRTAALTAFAFLAVVYGQQVGTNTAESHPQLSTQQCTTSGGCTTLSTSVVLDSNWRWLHTTTGYTNCYTGNTWDATLCPDPVTCAKNCALDGADYTGTYGITTSGDALTLGFVTGNNVGSRVYLLDDETTYHEFKLLNQEFTFDVDVSKLPCGLNGALYLTQMDADGGMAKYPTNKAGAKYGTGYCDAQCPQDIKFINGEANIIGWNATDSNSGVGSYGTCCSEMDIWEANSVSSAYTAHPCSVDGQTRCTGTDCGAGDERYDGVCDKDGCDFNAYRLGNKTFYGGGLTVDTTKPFTVVTQFITDDNTASGTLTEIRRIWVQNGQVIQNAVTNVAGVDATNSITDDFCTQEKTAFGDNPSFQKEGGLAKMGDSLSAGMVLSLSIWDDHTAGMYWLDSNYPLDEPATQPGIARGTCDTTSGDPSIVESKYPSAYVKFSNIKFGDLGSTFSASGSPGSGTTTTSVPSTTTTTTGPSQTGTVGQYGQCGGIGYTGATTCASPYTCHVINDCMSVFLVIREFI
ncbi:hypothetical protein EIP86_006366 [Pleurotus ostreatoroseus]|nr:hypothetical protein EIP86_006366 [Pleurotus ostreatoroseus]